ncbi:MAG: zinc-ribbon domain-containing protein, partial [Deltaproteobacteria bacterium]|nr:zinc-ribbon domain-containing protein [Deltaproteobacteria bacterium]
MRVVCDNCGASYKIPDSKLTREVNKATCRKCGNPILIRRPETTAKETAAHGPNLSTEERTLITSAAQLERQARMRASSGGQSGLDDAAMDPRPTQVSPDNSHTEATVPRDTAADLAIAAMHGPSEASTIVQSPTTYVTTTLVPEHLGPPRAAASPQPSMQVPGPIPPPTPMSQARAVA